MIVIEILKTLTGFVLGTLAVVAAAGALGGLSTWLVVAFDALIGR